MTSYERLYNAFFKRIEKDKAFFNYNGLPSYEALDLAKSRAKTYLNEAINILKLKCTLEIDIELNDEEEVIDVDLTSTEIYLISSLMYEAYLSRDISLLKVITHTFTSSDIKSIFSPANERKSFLEMYKKIQSDNLILIDDYNSRDRLSGKRRTIAYNSYGV